MPNDKSSEADAARQRLFNAKPEDSDAVIAQWLADYLLTGWEPGRGRRGRIKLSIGMLKERPRELTGDYRPRLGSLSFKPQTREEAASWIVKAALAGHAVFRDIGGMGSIEDIRERSKKFARYGRA